MTCKPRERPTPWSVERHDVQVDEHGSTVDMYYIVDANGEGIAVNWLDEPIYNNLSKEIAHHIVRLVNMNPPKRKKKL